jgi:hypothetical protein
LLRNVMGSRGSMGQAGVGRLRSRDREAAGSAVRPAGSETLLLLELALILALRAILRLAAPFFGVSAGCAFPCRHK